MSTVFNPAPIEDAVVALLAPIAGFGGQVFAATSLEGDVRRLTRQPPSCLVQVVGIQQDGGAQPMGKPIVRRMSLELRVALVGRQLRTEGTARATVGLHDLADDVLAALWGVQPTGCSRPFDWQSYRQLDENAELALLAWELTFVGGAVARSVT